MKTYTEVAEAVLRIGAERLARNKRRRKRLFAAGGALCIAALAAAFLLPHINYRQENKIWAQSFAQYPELPTQYESAVVYEFNPDDKRLMSGASDYVIAAHIAETAGTAYDKHDTPYTVYLAQNLRNIKGSLTTQTPVEIRIYGGVTRDKSRIVCLLPLPAQGADYVLYLTCAGDGNLYINKTYALYGMENGNVEEALANASHPMHALLLECVEACENEDTAFAPKVKNVSRYDTEFTEETTE